MADSKKEEEKLSNALKKVDEVLRKELGSRPYLLAMATGLQLEAQGDSITFSPQWSWRSNIIVGREDSVKLSEFLSEQLKDIVDNPENGVRKTYAGKK